MECSSKKSNNAICWDFSSGKDKTAIFIGYGGKVIEAVWIDEYGNIEKVNNEMKKQKQKKLTKDQKTIHNLIAEVNSLKSQISGKDYDVRSKQKEIDMLAIRLKDCQQSKDYSDTKVFQTRNHVAACINYAKVVKPGMTQHEVFQIVGKIQGRLEAAVDHDGYGMAVSGTINLAMDACGVETTTRRF